MDATLPATDNANAQVAALEALLLTAPQINLRTQHIVHAGMSARTIFIPADSALTGALTNCDNICVVYGDISVTTDAGVKRFTGFNVIPATKGKKRAGVTHADTWWTTLHVTSLTDIREIEDEMTSESSRLQTRHAGISYEEPTCLLD